MVPKNVGFPTNVHAELIRKATFPVVMGLITIFRLFAADFKLLYNKLHFSVHKKLRTTLNLLSVSYYMYPQDHETCINLVRCLAIELP